MQACEKTTSDLEIAPHMESDLGSPMCAYGSIRSRRRYDSARNGAPDLYTVVPHSDSTCICLRGGGLTPSM